MLMLKIMKQHFSNNVLITKNIDYKFNLRSVTKKRDFRVMNQNLMYNLMMDFLNVLKDNKETFKIFV